MRVGLVTSNSHKLAEARRILTDFEVVGIDVGEVAETGSTFEENAIIKAEAGRGRAPIVIGEDSGLVVDGLDGAPGIYSARYGPTDAERIARVLQELGSTRSRRARFVAVVCAVVDEDPPRCFEGVVEGAIALEPRGEQGFGYDPIFIPLGGDGRTFAELGEWKDALSHRRRALVGFADWARAFADRDR
ncbi:non-canonical purine NTP pyrophosphatase, rdgB/HAM1 family [Acidimicrobium ferrooxidans DSM 10331]|uniref:dITP/XTP pyrophosphatase n=1 Tax=Acidimicrobium ferrooxidans (strain DSM 10331 / JCM 15462 / NBRC 103882 / ICP) TaxID=525909 RepID=C7M108_ACIFD|nr:non-canonical purine NTP pyrophosphatase, rdgB/HAM1 family [Acidimicrobium ferrooxidans DSM 10331]